MDSSKTTPGPGRRRRLPRAVRERQMLDAAEAVFAERGYQASSMDDIAERAGLSKPMLYEYFGSKQGLLLACIDDGRRALLEAVLTASSGRAGPREALEAGTRAYIEFIRAHSHVWMVLIHERVATTSPVTDAVEEIRGQQTSLVTAVFARAVPEAAAVALQAYAEMFIGACDRLAYWLVRRPHIDVDQVTEHVMRIDWFGLVRDGSSAPRA